MQKLPDIKPFILPVIFILLFFVKGSTGLLLGCATLLTVLVFNKRLIRMFLNWGFFIFIILVLGVPLLFNASSLTLIENSHIVVRGIILIFAIFFIVNKFTSSSFYGKIENYLPEEAIKTIKVAFDIIPELQNKLENNFKKMHREKGSLFDSIWIALDIIIIIAEELAKDIEKQSRTKIYFITGEIHQGKSTLAMGIAKNAINKGYKTGGIISIGQIKANKRSGFTVLDLKTGNSEPLATTSEIDNYSEHIGPFYFYKKGMEFAKNSLNTLYLSDLQIIFIDEIGKLELQNKGFSKQLAQILQLENKSIFIVSRIDFIKAIEEYYNFKATAIIKVQPGNKDQGPESLSSKDTFSSSTAC